MDATQFALTFYQNLMQAEFPPEPAASQFARLSSARGSFRLKLSGGRTAFAERIGGRDARWRLQLSSLDGAQHELDTRCIEEHLDTAWQWHCRVEGHAIGRRILERVMENLGHPVVLIDEQGNILLRDRGAREMLADSQALRDVSGRLWMVQAGRPLTAHFLRSSGASGAGEATRPCSYALQVEAQSGTTIYLRANEILTHAGEAGLQPLWLVSLFAAPSDRKLEASALRQVLGLTRAEIRLVQLLFANQRLAEAAEALDISRETAKRHLSAVFRKCNVNSQAQLMQLIALGPFFARS